MDLEIVASHTSSRRKTCSSDSRSTSTFAPTTLHALLRDLGHVGCPASGLTSLLGVLLLPLLGFRLGDRGLTGGSTHFGLGGTFGEDGGKVCADDAALGGSSALVKY